MSRRVAVVGSRTFGEEILVRDWLSSFLQPGDTVVSGGANGPDSWAEAYAQEHGFDAKVYHAEWKKWGRAAGIKRNASIVADADVLLAFWDGESRGTADSIERARKKGIPLYIVGPSDRMSALPRGGTPTASSDPVAGPPSEPASPQTTVGEAREDV